jgi:cell wall-associated NlpC family hydrolase
VKATATAGAAVALAGLVLLAAVLAAVAGLVTAITTPGPGASGESGQEATPGGTVGDIPAGYFATYVAASKACSDLPWSVLAAVGKVESDHGRSPLAGVAPGTVNSASAGGPMQFLAPTFNSVIARHRIPPGGATPPSRWNAHDAIWAAAFLLCDSGAARGDLRAALFAYNHADWYVRKVLDQARRYAALGAQTTPEAGAAPGAGATPGAGPGARPEAAPGAGAAAAVAFARSKIGAPYVWGGNGPGFDCSGLTTAAYASAGISLPRTAQTQFNAGPRLPAGAPVQAGDLVFFGTPARIHHVGIALGEGSTLMINAPTFGQTVRIQDWRTLKDLAGFTRPANRRQ